jgi:predicted dehydrogenase
MAVLEWGRGAMATIRACGRKVAGGYNRRLRVTGTLGTAELCPVERFDAKPLLLELNLAKPCGGLPKGRQTLDFGPQGANGNVHRYVGQLREFARQVRGEEPEPEGLCAHDLAVQRTVLRMSGLPVE